MSSLRYRLASANAKNEIGRIFDEREEAREQLADEDRDNILRCEKIPWIAQLSTSGKPHWGFVCFRTGFENEELWTRYKEHILYSTKISLWEVLDSDYVSQIFKIDFVEDDQARLDDASIDDLRRYSSHPPTPHKSLG